MEFVPGEGAANQLLNSPPVTIMIVILPADQCATEFPPLSRFFILFFVLLSWDGRMLWEGYLLWQSMDDYRSIPACTARTKKQYGLITRDLIQHHDRYQLVHNYMFLYQEYIASNSSNLKIYATCSYKPRNKYSDQNCYYLANSKWPHIGAFLEKFWAPSLNLFLSGLKHVTSWQTGIKVYSNT